MKLMKEIYKIIFRKDYEKRKKKTKNNEMEKSKKNKINIYLATIIKEKNLKHNKYTKFLLKNIN